MTGEESRKILFIKRIEKDLEILLAKKEHKDFFIPSDLSYFRFEVDDITSRASIPVEFVEDLLYYVRYLKKEKSAENKATRESDPIGIFSLIDKCRIAPIKNKSVKIWPSVNDSPSDGINEIEYRIDLTSKCMGSLMGAIGCLTDIIRAWPELKIKLSFKVD